MPPARCELGLNTGLLNRVQVFSAKVSSGARGSSSPTPSPRISCHIYKRSASINRCTVPFDDGGVEGITRIIRGISLAGRSWKRRASGIEIDYRNDDRGLRKLDSRIRRETYFRIASRITYLIDLTMMIRWKS